MENLSQAIESGDVAFGGKMAKRFINEVTQDCKDVKNDDKYTQLRLRLTRIFF